MKNKVFVLGSHYNGLSIIQSLGRKNIQVYALDSSRTVGAFSKYSKFIKVTNPLEDPIALLNELIKLSTKEKNKIVLFPSNDEWAEFLSKNKSKLEENFILSCSNYEVVSMLLNKEAFLNWADGNDYLIPKVYSNPLEENIKFPVCLKTISRRSGFDTKISNKDELDNIDKFRYLVFHNDSDLKKGIKDAKSKNIKLLCQEVINGRSNSMRTIGFFSYHGEIKGILYGKKLRGYPPEFGDCVVGKCEKKVPQWALKMAKDIAKELNYTGIAEIELMKDSISAKHFLIEINPRSWSWVGVGEKSGVDLPLIAYQNLTDSSTKDKKNIAMPSKEATYIKLLSHIQNSLLWYRFTKAKDWTASPVGLIKEIISKKNTVYAEFNEFNFLIFTYVFIASLKEAMHNLKNLLK